MKKDFQRSTTLPTENGLVGVVSQAFTDTGYTLTLLETKCLSFIGYLPGRPGRGSCKLSAYALVKEECIYAAVISTDSHNVCQPKLFAVHCMPLNQLSHTDISKNNFRLEHRIADAFHSLGNTNFCHVEARNMLKIATDGIEDACATTVSRDIYLVYANKAYKVTLQ